MLKTYIELWISAKLIARIQFEFAAKNFHSNDGEEVEDQEEEASVRDEAWQDVDDRVDD